MEVVMKSIVTVFDFEKHFSSEEDCLTSYYYGGRMDLFVHGVDQ